MAVRTSIHAVSLNPSPSGRWMPSSPSPSGRAIPLDSSPFGRGGGERVRHPLERPFPSEPFTQGRGNPSLEVFVAMRNRLVTLLIAGLAFAANAIAAKAPSAAWSNANQMILVTVPDWNTIEGTLRTYQRDHGGAWREVGAVRPVVIGKSGAAWGIGLSPAQHDGPQKREGDGRSPAGVFRIGT